MQIQPVSVEQVHQTGDFISLVGVAEPVLAHPRTGHIIHFLSLHVKPCIGKSADKAQMIVMGVGENNRINGFRLGAKIAKCLDWAQQMRMPRLRSLDRIHARINHNGSATAHQNP